MESEDILTRLGDADSPRDQFLSIAIRIFFALREETLPRIRDLERDFLTRSQNLLVSEVVPLHHFYCLSSLIYICSQYSELESIVNKGLRIAEEGACRGYQRMPDGEKIIWLVPLKVFFPDHTFQSLPINVYMIPTDLGQIPIDADLINLLRARNPTNPESFKPLHSSLWEDLFEHNQDSHSILSQNLMKLLIEDLTQVIGRLQIPPPPNKKRPIFRTSQVFHHEILRKLQEFTIKLMNNPDWQERINKGLVKEKSFQGYFHDLFDEAGFSVAMETLRGTGTRSDLYIASLPYQITVEFKKWPNHFERFIRQGIQGAGLAEAGITYTICSNQNPIEFAEFQNEVEPLINNIAIDGYECVSWEECGREWPIFKWKSRYKRNIAPPIVIYHAILYTDIMSTQITQKFEQLHNLEKETLIENYLRIVGTPISVTKSEIIGSLKRFMIAENWTRDKIADCLDPLLD